MLLVAVLLAGCGPSVKGPEPGRPAALTWDQEIELGRKVGPDFEKHYGGQYADLAVQAYVRSVGERISRSTSHADLPYQFAVLASDTVNSFSLPGGPVYVTRGLLAKVSSEGQLAAVLAHEMGHVNARHAARELVREAGMQALLDVLGVSDGGVAPGAARYAEGRAKAVGALVSHHYTPDQEDEADRLGLDYMVAARYDPGQAMRVLQGFEALNGSKPVEWLSTHRGPANRIEGLQKIIQEKYPGRRGRTGEEEYKREVVERLAAPKP